MFDDITRPLLLGTKLRTRGPDGEVGYLVNPRMPALPLDTDAVTQGAIGVSSLTMASRQVLWKMSPSLITTAAALKNINKVSFAPRELHRTGEISLAAALREIGQLVGAPGVLKRGESQLYEFDLREHGARPNATDEAMWTAALSPPYHPCVHFRVVGPQTHLSPALLHGLLHKFMQEWREAADPVATLNMFLPSLQGLDPREHASTLAHLVKAALTMDDTALAQTFRVRAVAFLHDQRNRAVTKEQQEQALALSMDALKDLGGQPVSDLESYQVITNVVRVIRDLLPPEGAETGAVTGATTRVDVLDHICRAVSWDRPHSHFELSELLQQLLQTYEQMDPPGAAPAAFAPPSHDDLVADYAHPLTRAFSAHSTHLFGNVNHPIALRLRQQAHRQEPNESLASFAMLVADCVPRMMLSDDENMLFIAYLRDAASSDALSPQLRSAVFRMLRDFMASERSRGWWDAHPFERVEVEAIAQLLEPQAPAAEDAGAEGAAGA